MQHQSYQWLQLRSSLVPVVGVASNLSMIVIIAGLVLMQVIPFGFEIAAAGVGLFAMGTLFSFVTLPVEYDASNRALEWLQRKNMYFNGKHLKIICSKGIKTPKNHPIPAANLSFLCKKAHRSHGSCEHK